MDESAMDRPAVLILTGASGAGKTALTLRLSEQKIAGVECINCDRVKIDDSKTKDPSDYQASILTYWLSYLCNLERRIDLAVLDTQIRPHRAREVLHQAGILHSEIVLIDCDSEKRNARLCGERGQPELASVQMDCWAAYLRGQADALNLPIISTSDDSINKSLESLRKLVNELLYRVVA